MKVTLKTLVSLFLMSGLSLVACKKDDKVIESKEVFNDGNQVIIYQPVGDKIKFTIEPISDQTNSINGTFPDLDFYGIYVDVDQNGAVSSAVDLLFGPSNNSSYCVATLLSPVSTSACSSFQEVIGNNSFGTSDYSSSDHPIYTVEIPKTMLSNNSKAKFVVNVYGSGTGWEYYPSNADFFTDTFEITW